MSLSRRKFVKYLVGGTLAASLPVSAFKFLSTAQAKEAVEKSKVRWGFLVDTYKCVGCGFCVKACKNESEVPYDIPVSRTWVERYVITKDREAHIDSPKAGRDGFTSQKIRDEEIKPEDIAKAFFLPKLCNVCKRPPCVQVCPTGASFQTPDGVTLIDRSWCIGCAYCIMACPFGVRYFHPITKTADKCTYCYHRIHKGMNTACVQACPFGARQLANLRDLEDPITKIILTERVGVLKDEYGTMPQVYYLGIDENVR